MIWGGLRVGCCWFLGFVYVVYYGLYVGGYRGVCWMIVIWPVVWLLLGLGVA